VTESEEKNDPGACWNDRGQGEKTEDAGPAAPSLCRETGNQTTSSDRIKRKAPRTGGSTGEGVAKILVLNQRLKQLLSDPNQERNQKRRIAQHTHDSKINFSLRTNQEYNRSVEVITLPSSFDY
jgi:hypothetical protein